MSAVQHSKALVKVPGWHLAVCHAAGSWWIRFATAFVPQPFNRWHSLFWGSSLPFKRAEEAEEPTTWTRQSPDRPQGSAVLPLGTCLPSASPLTAPTPLQVGFEAGVLLLQ